MRACEKACVHPCVVVYSKNKSSLNLFLYKSDLITDNLDMNLPENSIIRPLLGQTK